MNTIQALKCASDPKVPAATRRTAAWLAFGNGLNALNWASTDAEWQDADELVDEARACLVELCEPSARCGFDLCQSCQPDPSKRVRNI